MSREKRCCWTARVQRGKKETHLMRNRFSRTWVVSVLGLALLFGPGMMAQTATKPMTNEDVSKMVKAGVREDIVLSTIQSTPTAFDVSPGAIVRLRKAGVSQKILDGMLTAA